MRIDDLIVLGRTVPEDSKRYGKRVCLAGVSNDLGVLRIYPTLIESPLRARFGASVEVERNPNDSRFESFKLKDAGDSILSISSSPVVGRQTIADWARPLAHKSISELNEQRRSLGFVAVRGRPHIEMKRRNGSVDSLQGELFDEFVRDLASYNGLASGSAYEFAPYLNFADADGVHSLQFREWGAYEFMRKYHSHADDVAEAISHSRHLLAPGEYFVLIGNMAHRRSVWLVIDVFWADTAQRVLFRDN